MPLIEVTDLRKRYGSRVAVDGVSFTVERGEVFGILGTNGAGKTTTVECLQGLRQADGGVISVLGLDPATDRAALTRRVGVQLQESQLPAKLRVREALELFASFYPDPADVDVLLDRLDLRDHSRRYFGKLSGGQKQRVSIALALVGNPELAILDELTTGLDPHARRETWRLVEGVRATGVTVLLVTHFMDEAERLCDRVALFDAGRVIATGTPAELRQSVNAATLDDAFVTLTRSTL
ncbi:ABC transporter ATP-binding protein [Amycolatopsis stemonae]